MKEGAGRVDEGEFGSDGRRRAKLHGVVLDRER